MKIDRRQIEKEAEDHIALGLLLRQRRSPARRREVEGILAGEGSVGQKVERIRRLDAEPEAAEPEAGADESAQGEGPSQGPEAARRNAPSARRPAGSSSAPPRPPSGPSCSGSCPACGPSANARTPCWPPGFRRRCGPIPR
jgi:hypothetical protein